MALNRVGLSINNEVKCTDQTILLTDTTGDYNVTTNPDGYGLPGGATKNNVTGLIINVTNEESTLYFTFTFTLSSSVIQTATLSVNGGTATDILSELASTAWPFTTTAGNEFSLFADYGVTVLSFEDNVWQVDYTISGDAVDDGGSTFAFNYTTSETFALTCTVECCVKKMYANLDPECSCSDSARAKANEVFDWIMAAKNTAEYGDTTKAIAALNKAEALCDCGCSDC